MGSPDPHLPLCFVLLLPRRVGPAARPLPTARAVALPAGRVDQRRLRRRLHPGRHRGGFIRTQRSQGGERRQAATAGTKQRTQPDVAPRLQAADLGIAEPAKTLDAPAILSQTPGATKSPDGRSQGRAGVAGSSPSEQDQRIEQGGEDQGGQDAYQGRQAVAGQQGADPVHVGQMQRPACVFGRGSGPQGHELRLEVADPGAGHGDDAPAGESGAPRQVEVLAELVDVRGKATERLEQVGAHQDRAARGHEDVAHAVVLGLVELACFQQGQDGAVAVGAHADAQQALGVGPRDHLRRGQPGVGTKGFLDQQADRVGRKGHVVVAEQIVGCPFDHVEDLVAGGPEAVPLGQATDVGARQDGRDSRSRVDDARRVHHQNGQVRIILSGDGRQAVLEPVTRVGGDDDHHDGRGRR